MWIIVWFCQMARKSHQGNSLKSSQEKWTLPTSGGAGPDWVQVPRDARLLLTRGDRSTRIENNTKRSFSERMSGRKILVGAVWPVRPVTIMPFNSVRWLTLLLLWGQNLPARLHAARHQNKPYEFISLSRSLTHNRQPCHIYRQTVRQKTTLLFSHNLPFVTCFEVTNKKRTLPT